jgi:hypothetical protein
MLKEALFEKLKLLSWSRNYPPLKEFKVLFRFSQVPTTEPCPEA